MRSIGAHFAKVHFHYWMNRAKGREERLFRGLNEIKEPVLLDMFHFMSASSLPFQISHMCRGTRFCLNHLQCAA